MKTFSVRLIMGAMIVALLGMFSVEVMAHEYEFPVKNQCDRTVVVTLYFTCGQVYEITLPPYGSTTLLLQTICIVRLAEVGDVEIEPGECKQIGPGCYGALRPGSFTAKSSCN